MRKQMMVMFTAVQNPFFSLQDYRILVVQLTSIDRFYSEEQSEMSETWTQSHDWAVLHVHTHHCQPAVRHQYVSCVGAAGLSGCHCSPCHMVTYVAPTCRSCRKAGVNWYRTKRPALGSHCFLPPARDEQK